MYIYLYHLTEQLPLDVKKELKQYYLSRERRKQQQEHILQPPAAHQSPGKHGGAERNTRKKSKRQRKNKEERDDCELELGDVPIRGGIEWRRLHRERFLRQQLRDSESECESESGCDSGHGHDELGQGMESPDPFDSYPPSPESLEPVEEESDDMEEEPELQLVTGSESAHLVRPELEQWLEQVSLST